MRYIVLEEALDQSFDRLLMMMMMCYIRYRRSPQHGGQEL